MHNNHRLASFIALLGILFGSTPTRSEETAKQKEDIRKAIDKGAEYLLKVHQPGPDYTGGSKKIGSACLAGMALLESGVEAKNPSLQNIIDLVRAGCLRQTGTYEVSLCLMFLDRLGQPIDEPLIQMLGARLMVGQGPTGGWSYQSGMPLSPKEENRLRGIFAADPKPLPMNPKPDGGRAGLHPEVGKLIDRMQDPRNQLRAEDDLMTALVKDGDNSNTQFAALALWCARKHGIPVEPSAKRLQKRFRAMQLRDGGWAYVAQLDLPIPIEINSTAAMTCAGLIGLAVSSGSTEAVLKNRPDGAKPPKKAPPNENDNTESIQAGLRTLGAFVSGRRSGEPELRIPDVLEIAPADGGEMRANLYALWSLERVAVIYGLDTIGNVDWYRWGAEALIGSQQPDGSWNSAFTGSQPDINAALALLFLHRTNAAKDLTAALVGKVRDPDAVGPKINKKDPNKKQAASATDLAKVSPPTDATEVDQEHARKVRGLADAVLVATGDAKRELLHTLRDAKGSAYTEALAQIASRAVGEAKIEACEALTVRLTRMTAATLREMLADPDREIRYAATRACGLKHDLQHVPDLIGLLASKDERLLRDAHQSLKRLTGKDFGPEPNSADADKIKAILAWRNWYKMQK